MQWILHKLTSTSGAAEPKKYQDIDEHGLAFILYKHDLHVVLNVNGIFNFAGNL